MARDRCLAGGIRLTQMAAAEMDLLIAAPPLPPEATDASSLASIALISATLVCLLGRTSAAAPPRSSADTLWPNWCRPAPDPSRDGSCGGRRWPTPVDDGVSRSAADCARRAGERGGDVWRPSGVLMRRAGSARAGERVVVVQGGLRSDHGRRRAHVGVGHGVNGRWLNWGWRPARSATHEGGRCLADRARRTAREKRGLTH